MCRDNSAPESDVPVADAPADNWVDRLAPGLLRPYMRLSRADRPIGTWLLLLPCWWGLELAIIYDDQISLHDLWVFAGCAIGAFLMRGAGCTWNDITDRKIDASVRRTASRPIPSGQISVRLAFAWLVIQAVAAFAILMTFNNAAILLGMISLVPVCVYPFAKRFTWWPQVFLGIAFNWGALLAWTAHRGQLEAPAIILYLAGIAWTLFYDTIYAHQDTEDDALIGVKSTARLFGSSSPIWLTGFLVASVSLMLLAVSLATEGLEQPIAICGAVAFLIHLLRQLRCFDMNDNRVLLRLFRSNRNAGLLVSACFAVAIVI
ncbi:MAG: 4-hydroxybenzoate octaprenyltransferase [Roseovarius sp.]|nr:4-hydroxybenzoate octaprenyltransferase [Roseovarius sp.]